MNKSLHAPLLLIALALLALLLGVLVYLLDRQAHAVYFVPQWLANAMCGDSFLGTLGNYTPTFVHVYAFILLTVALAVPAGRYQHYLPVVCFFWLIVDSSFEFAQLEFIGRAIAASVPSWFDGIPFLENTAAYFLTSTFDGWDVLSIVLGTLAAYLTVRAIATKFPTDGTTLNKQ